VDIDYCCAPEWITFTPDGKTLYVSNSGERSVSVIDTDTRQIVAIIPVGEVPKRIKSKRSRPMPAMM
jgi:YVTN family beta-propeller protein